MRLLVAAAAILTFALAGTAPAATSPDDLRAPDQQVGPAAATSGAADLRAPDQQAGPAEAASGAADLRAPDQQVGPASAASIAAAGSIGADLRAPDQQTPVPAVDIADGGPAAIVFILIGLGGILAVLAGVGVRYRHQAAAAAHRLAAH